MKQRKPRIGFLFIAAERFMPLGEGTAEGTYSSRKQAEMQQYIRAFSAVCEPVSSGAVCTAQMAEASAKQFFADDVDGVVAIFLSWAEDFAWNRFLRELPDTLPVMLATVVRDALAITDTNDENQFIDFLSAGALVGFQEASGSLRRFARPMSELAVGTLDELTERVRVYANACRVRKQLRQTHMGLLACYNEAMWATYMDIFDLFRQVGPELHFLSVAELQSRVEALEDTAVEKLVRRLCSCYSVADGVDREKLFASVRATYAMELLAEEKGIDLLSLNDIDTVLFRYIGLRPGFYPLTDEAPVTVPEGDLGGALAVYILRLLAGSPANFIEPFYIDAKNGLFVAGHAGPNDYTEKPENMVIARDERFAKSGWRYAGAPFAWYVFPVGEKTMLHMSETNGRIKMVATVVDCIETPHYLASYSHAHFRPRGKRPAELFEQLGAQGITQHYGIVAGNHLQELRQLARLLGVDYAEC